MKLYICVPVIIASVFLFHSHTEASVAQKLVPANPSYPGKCYDEDTKAAYAVGEIWNKRGECVQYACNTAPENQFLITITGCGVIAIEPPCRLANENPTESYPKCCPKPVCD